MTASGATASGRPTHRPVPVRVAVVAADDGRRSALVDALSAADGLEPVAWADAVETLLVLGTRADVCVCAEPPPADLAARLSTWRAQQTAAVGERPEGSA